MAENGATTLFSMAGKTVLVTGGGTGLGCRFAETLGAAGARIIISGRRQSKLDAAVEGLIAAGINATAITMDVADAASVDAGFEAAGGPAVDVLVNNAGVVAPGSLAGLCEEDWSQVQDTNLKGAWLAGRAFLRQVPEGGGAIINVASILGLCVQKGTGAYTASKAGLLHLSRQMAVEWARHGVRVNALLPGYYRTDIAEDYLDTPEGEAMIRSIPARRLGDPADLDGAILLLASDAGRYITGATLTVDGGLSLPRV